MPRLLTVLMLVQILVLGFLGVELMGLRDQVEHLSLATSAPGLPDSTVVSIDPTPAALANPGPVASSTKLSLDDIRALVREELDLAMAGLAVAGNEPVNKPPVHDPAESMVRLYDMHQLIDEHIEQGEISEQDMAGLQMQMAKLNPEDRDKILRRLTRAMNAGDINARF